MKYFWKFLLCVFLLGLMVTANEDVEETDGNEEEEEELDANEELSNEDVVELSKKCGELRYEKNKCIEDMDCVYVNHYIDRFKESMNFCYSFEELMRFYIIDDKIFIKSRKLKAFKFINRDNFCDVIQRLEFPFGFLNIDGKVLDCQMTLK